MKYLIDTCVMSELWRPSPDLGVIAFMKNFQDQQWLSVVTRGELTLGATSMPTGRRQVDLLSWIDGLKANYATRIIGVDLGIAETWGRISGDLRRRGIQVAIADGLIAATAIQHGMRVVTRNVKDFEPTGVLIVNPWDKGSPATL